VAKMGTKRKTLGGGGGTKVRGHSKVVWGRRQKGMKSLFVSCQIRGGGSAAGEGKC